MQEKSNEPETITVKVVGEPEVSLDDYFASIRTPDIKIVDPALDEFIAQINKATKVKIVPIKKDRS